MTISDRPSFPTATINSIRLQLFQPTRRPVAQVGAVIETAYGKIKVYGRLGQAHADVFEAICYEREKKAELEDGRIKLLVDPARVARRAGVHSGEQLKKLITELQQAVIEIIEPDRLRCVGHLVDHIDIATRADGTKITRRNPLTGGERALWRVEIGKAFCRLVARDVWVGYDPAPLTRLRYGVSQAIARYVLTHKQSPRGGWKLDTLIEAVGGGGSDQRMRDRRREIREDAEALAWICIKVNGDRVSVEQTRDSVEQTRDGVEQTRDGVEQTRDFLPV